MIILDGTEEIGYEGRTRVCIGKFDGIHLGHRKLINMITNRDDAKSVVFTFTVSSEDYLSNNERIYSEDERRKRFEDLNVDYLVEFDLNDKTVKMEPEDFARIILHDRLHAKEVVCGPDLSFGYRGRGDTELLSKLGEELDIKVTVVDKVLFNGDPISSTRIREAIANGDTADADAMLGN